MASDPQQQSPPKKRRQWRRVLVRVFGVLLLAIIVWILAILPDDDLVPPGELRLASEPVPNELNAAWQLSALGKRIQGPVVYRLSNEFWIERDSSDEPDLATHGDVLNHVRSNEPLIADIRGALKLDRWYIPFEVTDEFIAGVADIGEYLLVSELIAMERGDVDAGLSIFSLSLRMVHLAIAGAQDWEQLRSALWIGQDRLESLRQFAHRGSWSAEQLRQALALLPETRSTWSDVVRASRGQYEVFASWPRLVEENSRRAPFRESELPSWAPMALVYKPNKTLNAQLALLRHWIELTPSTYADLEEHLPKPDVTLGQGLAIVGGGNWIGELVVINTPANFEMTVQNHFEMNAHLALLRTWLALKIHETEHGSLPTALEDLVPSYLQEAPLDPFDGQGLRYSREQRTVHSIGHHSSSDNWLNWSLDQDGTED